MAAPNPSQAIGLSLLQRNKLTFSCAGISGVGRTDRSSVRTNIQLGDSLFHLMPIYLKGQSAKLKKVSLPVTAHRNVHLLCCVIVAVLARLVVVVILQDTGTMFITISTRSKQLLLKFP